MEQRLSLVTLGVRDVARSKAFYEALGWRGQEVDGTVFFQAGGIALVLWGRELLAADNGIERDEGTSYSGMVLAHNVRSVAEVDATLLLAQKAGAAISRPAAETFYGGYAGTFRDPDGHTWEIAFNPGFPLDQAGNITISHLG